MIGLKIGKAISHGFSPKFSTRKRIAEILSNGHLNSLTELFLKVISDPLNILYKIPHFFTYFYKGM